MSAKHRAKDISESDESSKESPLERHVDEMMELNRPASVRAASSAPPLSDTASDTADDITAEHDVVDPEQAAGAIIEPEAPPATPSPATDDELLASRYAEQHTTGSATEQPHQPRRPLRHLLGAWWHNKPTRYATILVLLAGIGALGAMPTSRYYAMNTVGVRSAASLTIMDNTTLQPLKNVTVELGERSAKTNQDGLVKLSGLALGTQSLTIRQSGFATISRTVTLGLGSNPLGEFSLDAVGMQFRFKLTDYLSGKPVKDAEISSGDSNARGDDKGQIVLTLGQVGGDNSQAKITVDGYRPETVSLDAGEKQSQSLALVPDRKEIYISKQSGKYDLYKVDLDGRNRQLLLAASGHEDADISIVQHHSGNHAGLVSRRDTLRNQDGFPLQALTIVDVTKGTTLLLDHSERIQIVDWTGDKLIYVKIKAGTSAGNPERYQLMSYDVDSTARLQLATANYFNDVVSAGGSLYYAASNNYDGGSSQFVRINPDNSSKQVLLDKTEIWNIARTSYDTLDLSFAQGTYGYKLGEPAPRKTSDKPASNNETRFYLDAPSDNSHAIWTDSRDGKGVLLVYNSKTAKDKALVTASGLTYPVRWLNDRTVIYRINTPAETADYAVSLDGGAPRKITDLTSTGGLGRLNYR